MTDELAAERAQLLQLAEELKIRAADEAARAEAEAERAARIAARPWKRPPSE